MKASEILRGAIDNLRKYGWARYTLQDDDGLCAQGAMHMAVTGRSTWIRDHPDFPQHELALHALVNSIPVEALDICHRYGGYDGNIVAAFNNMVCQSADELEIYMEKAAIALEEVGK